MSLCNRLTTAFVFSTTLGIMTGVQAGTYPTQPVKMIVGYAPGGSVDTFARIIAPELAKELGQTVVVENVAGAGGTIGVNRAVNARPDGYTILMGIVSDIVIAPLVQESVRYTYDDLLPVASLGMSGVGVVANPQLDMHSFADLIRVAKERPGELTYGATGVGSLPAIAMESFKKITDTDITFIPYSSASKIATDVIGGTIDIAVSGLPALLELIKSGRVTAVGVMSHERDIGKPDMQSAGDTPELKGMDYYFWTGVFAPLGTPGDITRSINAAFNRAMSNPEIQERFRDLGVKTNATMTPAEFSTFVANSHLQWRKAIEEAGIPRQ